MEAQVAQRSQAFASAVATRDKRVKDLEAQVSALDKSKESISNGNQVGSIDYSLVDNITAAQKRRCEIHSILKFYNLSIKN